MKRALLTALAIIAGMIHIFIIPAEPVGVKIATKLIPMALIIVIAFTTRSFLASPYKKLITIGLFVCMIADGVIYYFMAGLVTFFFGHLFYIAAFKKANRQPVPLWAGIPLLLYGAGMAAWIAYPQFAAGDAVLGAAIIAYIAVILLMGWTAIGTGIKTAIIGAMLFILSDSALAVDRFVTELPYRDALVMVTYYAAQLFIAYSVGSRVVKYSVKRKYLIR